MNAKEFRIGNYVQAGKLKGVIVSINNSSAKIMFGHGGSSSYGLKDFQPVPLTDDIFLRFGFRGLSVGDDYYFNIKTEPQMSCGEFEVWKGSRSENEYNFRGGINCKFKYVHQLQNIYFVLTQKELEIK